MILGGLLAVVAAWAETPSLERKATDPSFFAVTSLAELKFRRFEDPALSSSERRGLEPGEWNWLGRRLELLETSRDTALDVGFGNEVGDPLFRETQFPKGEKPANHNPAMWAHLPVPRIGSVRAAVDFEQIDHFSDASLGVRADRLGNPSLTGQGPRVRRAWFGENLPHASFVGGRVWGGQNLSWAVSGRSGWLWLAAPVSQDLQAWRVDQGEAGLAWKGWSWRHAQARFERADTLAGSLDQAQGWIGTDVLGDSALRAGVRYAWDDSRGHAWRPERKGVVEPWASVRARRGAWAWKGFHAAGADGYRLRDTLAWEPGDSVRVALAAQWTDRPEGTPPSWDSSEAGLAIDDCRDLEQTYALALLRRWEVAAGTLELESIPWAIHHQHAFQATGYATDGGWIRRAGRTVALPGWLWGWKGRMTLRQDLSERVSMDGVLQADPVWGDARARADLTPPLWGAGLGATVRHPSGLSMHAQMLWRDVATVRNASPQDWEVPAGWDLNLWIRQGLLQDRLELECAALGILADEARQTPNGGENRFRLLVRLRARLW